MQTSRIGIPLPARERRVAFPLALGPAAGVSPAAGVPYGIASGSLLRSLVAGSFLVLLRRVLVPRCALGEERRRPEGIVPAKASFDYDVDAVGEGVRRDASIHDVIALCAVRHPECDLPPTGIAHNRAIDHPRANLHSRLVERGIGSGFRGKFGGCQVVDARIADGTRSEVAGDPNDQGTADDELGARFHTSIYDEFHVIQ